LRIGIDNYIKYYEKIHTFLKRNFGPKRNQDATYQHSLRWPSFIDYSAAAERYLEYEEVGEFF